MKKRICRTLLTVLIIFLILIFVFGAVIWFRFRSPSAMKRQGWDYADSIGSRMTVKPDAESFTRSMVISVHDYSQFRLETDSVVNEGSVIISIYILEDYNSSKSLLDLKEDEDKELVECFEIEQDGHDVFDFSDYDVGDYLITIGWGDENTDAYCDYTLKNNLYIWQSRYNSLIYEYPFLKKIHGEYKFSD